MPCAAPLSDNHAAFIHPVLPGHRFEIILSLLKSGGGFSVQTPEVHEDILAPALRAMVAPEKQSFQAYCLAIALHLTGPFLIKIDGGKRGLTM
jgi:hypothetical protein